ncbi:hypothetical protein ASPBRDRAFT_417424 [Aspergillus brasiliensis CBS 101740]|uniref:Uncharacterized protein n=1 Tax=Aspergillus brasiliensis (strain CBS 101740 / IMI 381727 / IBT 21946) TaxID=767769 RepID=A0A1L9UYK4_ASPBC|nr:hypothetical protein ASPBRDRAFT_417424 [Aspergillus brasiliensis CBS 101740]
MDISSSHKEYRRCCQTSGKKKYTPKSISDPEPGYVTIIGAHGSAFSKELYEPIWEQLYINLKASGVRIRSIWIADTANQGVSGARAQ